MENFSKSEIITAELPSEIFVLAKPGVGKTFTLVHRVLYLLDLSCPHFDELKIDDTGYGLYSDAIQVLSFSRASVKILKDRLVECSGRLVAINTIDSFVAKILHRCQLYDSRHSYDRHIEEFCKLLQQNDQQVLDELSHLDYLVIDEAQDVIGIRLEMIKLLCEKMEEGWMVFLDPNQFIFGFVDDTTSTENIQEILGTNAKQVTIESENHRLSDRLQELEAKLIAVLNSHFAYREGMNILKQSEFQELDDFSNFTLPAMFLGKNTAIMWEIFDKLVDQNYSPKLLPRSVEHTFPTWLGQVFYDFQDQTITQDQFMTRYVDRIYDSDRNEAQQKWKQLCKLVDEDELISLDDLLNSLQSPAVSDELFELTNHSLLISSIHRAKGKEYENIVLVLPKYEQFDKDQAKLIYVGATRAISHFSYMIIDSYQPKFIPHVQGYPINRWYTRRGPAVSVGRPVDFSYDGMFLQLESMYHFFENQHILSQIEIGQEVDIAFNFESERWDVYLIRTENHEIIGKKFIMTMSEEMTYSIKKICKKYKKELPGFLKGARVFDIVTEVLPLNSEYRTYCPSGIYLSLKVGGGKCYFGGTNYR